MLHHTPHVSFKSLCTTPKSHIWRTRVKQNQLSIQISSILLQRLNWEILLRNLSPKLTPPLFLQIIHKTQSNPEISIAFFNWARHNLGFGPDLKSNCRIIELAIRSGHYKPAKSIVDSLLKSEPTSNLVRSLIQASCKSSQSHVLSFVLEAYSNKGSVSEGLVVYRNIRALGCVPSIPASNALLNALEKENKLETAWCFYAAMIRTGVPADDVTWMSISRILCKKGKLETIARMIDFDIYCREIYRLIIAWYSKIGNFADAFVRLNEMQCRKIVPDFSTLSSILDGACKHENVKVIAMITNTMVKKGVLSECPLDYDSVIQKLCGLGLTYAADMFRMRALDEKVGLKDPTHGCMLSELSKEGRVKEAIRVYQTISEDGILVNDTCYNSFVSVLCKEIPTGEVSKMLKDMIRRGLIPCTSDMSRFIASQCEKSKWGDAEELLNVVLEKGILPDFLCCSSLVKHYCRNRRVDVAIDLHFKITKLNGKLDSTTYVMLLKGLFMERRADVAVRVFDYVRNQNSVNSSCFATMINGLCREKELRKAMKLHDEMLKMGLKPDERTYKRMIIGFK